MNNFDPDEFAIHTGICVQHHVLFNLSNNNTNISFHISDFYMFLCDRNIILSNNFLAQNNYISLPLLHKLPSNKEQFILFELPTSLSKQTHNLFFGFEKSLMQMRATINLNQHVYKSYFTNGIIFNSISKQMMGSNTDTHNYSFTLVSNDFLKTVQTNPYFSESVIIIVPSKQRLLFLTNSLAISPDIEQLLSSESPLIFMHTTPIFIKNKLFTFVKHFAKSNKLTSIQTTHSFRTIYKIHPDDFTVNIISQFSLESEMKQPLNNLINLMYFETYDGTPHLSINMSTYDFNILSRVYYYSDEDKSHTYTQNYYKLFNVDNSNPNDTDLFRIQPTNLANLIGTNRVNTVLACKIQNIDEYDYLFNKVRVFVYSSKSKNIKTAIRNYEASPNKQGETSTFSELTGLQFSNYIDVIYNSKSNKHQINNLMISVQIDDFNFGGKFPRHYTNSIKPLIFKFTNNETHSAKLPLLEFNTKTMLSFLLDKEITNEFMRNIGENILKNIQEQVSHASTKTNINTIKFACFEKDRLININNKATVTPERFADMMNQGYSFMFGDLKMDNNISTILKNNMDVIGNKHNIYTLLFNPNDLNQAVYLDSGYRKIAYMQYRGKEKNDDVLKVPCKTLKMFFNNEMVTCSGEELYLNVEDIKSGMSNGMRSSSADYVGGDGSGNKQADVVPNADDVKTVLSILEKYKSTLYNTYTGTAMETIETNNDPDKIERKSNLAQLGIGLVTEEYNERVNNKYSHVFDHMLKQIKDMYIYFINAIFDTKIDINNLNTYLTETHFKEYWDIAELIHIELPKWYVVLNRLVVKNNNENNNEGYIFNTNSKQLYDFYFIKAPAVIKFIKNIKTQKTVYSLFYECLTADNTKKRSCHDNINKQFINDYLIETSWMGNYSVIKDICVLIKELSNVFNYLSDNTINDYLKDVENTNSNAKNVMNVMKNLNAIQDNLAYIIKTMASSIVEILQKITYNDTTNDKSNQNTYLNKAKKLYINQNNNLKLLNAYVTNVKNYLENNKIPNNNTIELNTIINKLFLNKNGSVIIENIKQMFNSNINYLISLTVTEHAVQLLQNETNVTTSQPKGKIHETFKAINTFVTEIETFIRKEKTQHIIPDLFNTFTSENNDDSFPNIDDFKIFNNNPISLKTALDDDKMNRQINNNMSQSRDLNMHFLILEIYNIFIENIYGKFDSYMKEILNCTEKITQLEFVFVTNSISTLKNKMAEYNNALTKIENITTTFKNDVDTQFGEINKKLETLYSNENPIPNDIGRTIVLFKKIALEDMINILNKEINESMKTIKDKSPPIWLKLIHEPIKTIVSTVKSLSTSFVSVIKGAWSALTNAATAVVNVMGTGVGQIVTYIKAIIKTLLAAFTQEENIATNKTLGGNPPGSVKKEKGFSIIKSLTNFLIGIYKSLVKFFSNEKTQTQSNDAASQEEQLPVTTPDAPVTNEGWVAWFKKLFTQFTRTLHDLKTIFSDITGKSIFGLSAEATKLDRGVQTEDTNTSHIQNDEFQSVSSSPIPKDATKNASTSHIQTDTDKQQNELLDDLDTIIDNLSSTRPKTDVQDNLLEGTQQGGFDVMQSFTFFFKSVGHTLANVYGLIKNILTLITALATMPLLFIDVLFETDSIINRHLNSLDKKNMTAYQLDKTYNKLYNSNTISDWKMKNKTRYVFIDFIYKILDFPRKLFGTFFFLPEENKKITEFFGFDDVGKKPDNKTNLIIKDDIRFDVDLKPSDDPYANKNNVNNNVIKFEVWLMRNISEIFVFVYSFMFQSAEKQNESGLGTVYTAYTIPNFICMALDFVSENLQYLNIFKDKNAVTSEGGGRSQSGSGNSPESQQNTNNTIQSTIDENKSDLEESENNQHDLTEESNIPQTEVQHPTRNFLDLLFESISRFFVNFKLNNMLLNIKKLCKHKQITEKGAIDILTRLNEITEKIRNYFEKKVLNTKGNGSKSLADRVREFINWFKGLFMSKTTNGTTTEDDNKQQPPTNVNGDRNDDENVLGIKSNTAKTSWKDALNGYLKTGFIGLAITGAAGGSAFMYYNYNMLLVTYSTLVVSVDTAVFVLASVGFISTTVYLNFKTKTYDTKMENNVTGAANEKSLIEKTKNMMIDISNYITELPKKIKNIIMNSKMGEKVRLLIHSIGHDVECVINIIYYSTCCKIVSTQIHYSLSKKVFKINRQNINIILNDIKSILCKRVIYIARDIATNNYITIHNIIISNKNLDENSNKTLQELQNRVNTITVRLHNGVMEIFRNTFLSKGYHSFPSTNTKIMQMLNNTNPPLSPFYTDIPNKDTISMDFIAKNPNLGIFLNTINCIDTIYQFESLLDDMKQVMMDTYGEMEQNLKTTGGRKHRQTKKRIRNNRKNYPRITKKH
jgi:hypothetical protein